MLAATFDAAAMKPHHNRCIVCCRRVIDIEFATLLGIACGYVTIRDVVDLIILRTGYHRTKQECDGEEIVFVSHSFNMYE